MTDEKVIHEPLFHIVKRDVNSKWQVILIKVISIAIALVAAGILCLVIYGANPFTVYYEIINGVFIIPGQFEVLLKDMALLLGVGIALIPSFKMKYWNLGGNGQVLMGVLGAVICMFYLGGKVNDVILWILMLITSVSLGTVWAVIPAIFKAKWNTNETLFTLMMNYIACKLVKFFLKIWAKDGSGTLGVLQQGHLPKLWGSDYILTILLVIAVTAFMILYLKKSKHGYELSVVGESVNTAKYVGINVKKTIIRTVALSGAICGLIGLCIGGAIDCSIAEDASRNLGFTAIISVWIANADPAISVLSSFGIVFLTQGMGQAQAALGMKEAVISMIVGLTYLFIIGSDFFLSFAIKMRNKKNSKGEK